MAENTSAVETTKDYGKGDEGVVSRWLSEIQLAEKDHNEYWKRCKKITDRYRDKRIATDTDTRKLNIFWSNIQTLLPALYARTPKPDIQRRFKDADPAARNAAEVLERAADFTVSAGGFDETVRACVLDYALVARGQAWVRYKPCYRDADKPAAGESAAAESDEPADDKEAEPAREVVFEEVEIDHVHWSDFLHNPARTWAEVRWVDRRTFLTRDQLCARFGDKIGSAVPLDYSPEGVPDKDSKDAGPQWEAFKKATVHEIWDRPSRKVYWIAKEYKKGPLDTRDDPLRLKHFFPCPRPALGTIDNSNIIPTPDFIEYQDQAAELDDLTGRIATLSKALKVVGVYDASCDELKRLLEEGVDNTMIPVTNWGAFGEKSGLKGATDWLPIKQVIETLMQLYEARDQVKQSLYEITGLSDIIRGESDPQETATAQSIKGRFGTMRLQDRQGEIQRFARDLVRLTAEIVAEHFSQDTLRLMTGMQMPTRQQVMDAQKAAQAQAQMAAVAQMRAQQAQQQPQPGPQGPPLNGAPPGGPGPMPPPQQAPQAAPPGPPEQPQGPPPGPPPVTWEDVMDLLKADGLRSFRIDIETDSTIAVDEEAEKSARTEFLTAVGGFMQSATPLVQEQPAMAPLIGEMLLFVVRSFKAGRSLEEAFETAVDQMNAAAKQAQSQPPQPDPKLIAAQTGAAVKAQEIQSRERIAQATIAQKDRDTQADAGATVQAAQADAQAWQHDTAMRAQEHLMDSHLDASSKVTAATIDAQTDLESARIKASAEVTKAQVVASRPVAPKGPQK